MVRLREQSRCSLLLPLPEMRLFVHLLYSVLSLLHLKLVVFLYLVQIQAQVLLVEGLVPLEEVRRRFQGVLLGRRLAACLRSWRALLNMELVADIDGGRLGPLLQVQISAKTAIPSVSRGS